ncbi:MAG: hypothetical protein E6G44_08045 [Actinobacteria bacterium]|nr:MAG: hypothetical protein E6G44_08045 [Actinomycetota bacterium]
MPSSDPAIFNVTNGRPVRTCLANPAISSRASVSSSPTSTDSPASRRCLTPAPSTIGLGSRVPATKRAIQNVLIEGGPTVAGSAIGSGIVDRFVLYVAPKLIGGREAPGILGGRGVPSVGDALPVEIVRVERWGDDIKVVADVHRDR